MKAESNLILVANLELARALCAALGRELPAGDDAEALQAALQAGFSRARTASPEPALDAAALLAYLAARLPKKGPLAEVAGIHFEDLHLASACLRGEAAALSAFDLRLRAEVAAQVARFGRSPDFADEVLQELRAALLVPFGKRSAGRLSDYSGRGPLGRFLQVAAMRTAVSLQRAEKPGGTDELPDLMQPGPDPELDFIKLRDRGAVAAALRDALSGLDPRDLGLLRLHYVEQVSLEKLAAVNRVHRATAARWLAAARDQVLSRSRALLRERLSLSSSECDSLIALVRSRLEASLARAFAPTDAR